MLNKKQETYLETYKTKLNLMVLLGNKKTYKSENFFIRLCIYIYDGVENEQEILHYWKGVLDISAKKDSIAEYLIDNTSSFYRVAFTYVKDKMKRWISYKKLYIRLS